MDKSGEIRRRLPERVEGATSRRHGLPPDSTLQETDREDHHGTTVYRHRRAGGSDPRMASHPQELAASGAGTGSSMKLAQYVIARGGQYKQPSPQLREATIRERRARFTALAAGGWL